MALLCILPTVAWAGPLFSPAVRDFLTLLLLAAIAVFLWRIWHERRRPGPGAADDSALATLRLRLARGEIDAAEYERLRRLLDGDRG
ncbi:SHOCT domain-containing protein [Sinimarinibacterium sp. HSW-8]|uniref:SHOCT domain-containing protein n=2 Tax=Sinimarinibacterium thermocellulolyticum TaxID=3170016 RepID=A0ABV2AAJ6_9GAMM